MAGDTKVYEGTTQFEGARFRDVSFAGAEFRNVNMANAKIADALLLNADISGMIDGLKVNGVEVAPLIEAEMVRRHPELAKVNSRDLDEMREGLRIVEDQLAATLERVRALPEAERHRRVDDEWSVVETVRHLVFVVDLWIRRQSLGLDDAYHPIGLPPSHAPASPPGTDIDAGAQPSFDEAMAVWDGRLSEVRDLLAGLDDERADATSPLGPGFPARPRTVPARQGLQVFLREAWWHNRYMTRDLDRIEAAAG